MKQNSIWRRTERNLTKLANMEDENKQDSKYVNLCSNCNDIYLSISNHMCFKTKNDLKKRKCLKNNLI